MKAKAKLQPDPMTNVYRVTFNQVKYEKDGKKVKEITSVTICVVAEDPRLAVTVSSHALRIDACHIIDVSRLNDAEERVLVHGFPRVQQLPLRLSGHDCPMHSTKHRARKVK